MSKLSAKKAAIALLPADEADVLASRRFFGDADSEWLLARVNDKKLNAHVIHLDGVPKYILLWHKDVNDNLHVNCAIEKHGGGDLPGLVAGAKQLARENGCFGITFNTKRKGLFAEMAKLGFEFHGVAMAMRF